MSDVVVYAARPERALAIAAHLQGLGVPCRVVQGPAMIFPWVMVAQPRDQVVVAEPLAGRARELLASVGVAEAGVSGRLAHSVRWPLAGMALSAVGVVAFGIDFSAPRALRLSGTLISVVALVGCFIWLRRASRAQPWHS